LSIKAKVFGAALDYLDDPDRLSLKLSYVHALNEGIIDPSLPADPYDAIAPALVSLCNGSVELHGKIDIPGWLTPRPRVEDLGAITPENYREFMDRGGPEDFADECAGVVESTMPDVPVMIAVDHSLSAGPIKALSRRFGTESLAVVMLDSHFDATPVEARTTEGGRVSWKSDGLCGAFLDTLIRNGFIFPENLFVIGVSDYPTDEAAASPYGKHYLSWVEAGVKIFPKELVRQQGFCYGLGRELINTGARNLYVSMDADVGSCACMNAVRFMDTVGLDETDLLEIAKTIRGLVDEGRFTLGGLDVSEVEVHLLGLPGPDGTADRTAEICAGFLATILGGGDDNH